MLKQQMIITLTILNEPPAGSFDFNNKHNTTQEEQELHLTVNHLIVFLAIGLKCPTCAVEMSRFSKLSALPPSQYCRDCTKFRASWALSLGRNLSTFGRVRTSFSRPSSKLSLFCRNKA